MPSSLFHPILHLHPTFSPHRDVIVQIFMLFQRTAETYVYFSFTFIHIFIHIFFILFRYLSSLLFFIFRILRMDVLPSTDTLLTLKSMTQTSSWSPRGKCFSPFWLLSSTTESVLFCSLFQTGAERVMRFKNSFQIKCFLADDKI